MPPPRAISQKTVKLDREEGIDVDGESTRELGKSLRSQEKELKRIMQSQKSLANATKSIAKLMKVHDQTSTFSMLDVKKGVTNRGSA